MLRARAQEDLTALRRWANDPEIADSILGFHAQQAVEKLLKAVLVQRDVQFARTHDLKYLVELLADEELVLPVDVADLVDLTEYAVAQRYDEPLEEDEAFDRAHFLVVVVAVCDWADHLLGTGSAS